MGSGSISPLASRKMISHDAGPAYATAVGRPSFRRIKSPAWMGKTSKRSRACSAADWLGIRYQPCPAHSRRTTATQRGRVPSSQSLAGRRQYARSPAAAVVNTMAQRSPAPTLWASISTRLHLTKSCQTQDHHSPVSIFIEERLAHSSNNGHGSEPGIPSMAGTATFCGAGSLSVYQQAYPLSATWSIQTHVPL